MFNTLGYAFYFIEKDNISLVVESPSITFALAVCQNCGFMASFDEDILVKKFENYIKIAKIKVKMENKKSLSCSF